MLAGVVDTPGEVSVTFAEVALADVKDGDLDLVGLTASRFLDGLNQVSNCKSQRTTNFSPRPQSLSSPRRIKNTCLVQAQTPVAFSRLL